ncbi:MAG TPA: hypothetical protein PLP19_12765 [bacterium]|nr:hypothetical protein [bacterium]HPN44357.1 hypothetical protein [bacterium]
MFSVILPVRSKKSGVFKVNGIDILDVTCSPSKSIPVHKNDVVERE